MRIPHLINGLRLLARLNELNLEILVLEGIPTGDVTPSDLYFPLNTLSVTLAMDKSTAPPEIANVPLYTLFTEFQKLYPKVRSISLRDESFVKPWPAPVFSYLESLSNLEQLRIH